MTERGRDADRAGERESGHERAAREDGAQHDDASIAPADARDARDGHDARAWEQLSMVDAVEVGGTGPPSPRRTARPRGAHKDDRKHHTTDDTKGERGEMARTTAADPTPNRTMPAAEIDMPLEAALARLEAIVRELEAGNIDLDRSLVLFEEGVGLSRLASKRLTEAEVKIAKLVRSLDGGFTTEPFDAGEGPA